MCSSLHPETSLDPPHMNLQWALPLLISVYNIYIAHDRVWILEPGLTRLWLLPAEFHLWPHKSDSQWSNEIGTETIGQERTDPWIVGFLINELFWRPTRWLLGPNVTHHLPLQPCFRRENWSSRWKAWHPKKGQCWLHKCHPYLLPVPANSANSLGAALAQHAKPRHNAANCVSPLVPFLWKGEYVSRSQP